MVSFEQGAKIFELSVMVTDDIQALKNEPELRREAIKRWATWFYSEIETLIEPVPSFEEA